MEYTNLKEKPKCYQETINLIEDSFEYDEHFQFDEDFSTLVSKENWENCHIIIEKSSKKVIGHIGVQLKTMVFNNVEVPIAILGGIAVHSDYRNQGLFKELSNIVLQQYSKEVTFFILWSDQYDLYKKFGFHIAGGFIQTGNEDLPKDIEGMTRTTLNKISKEEFQEIKDLYLSSVQKKYFTVKRTDEDWAKLTKVVSASLYLLKENNVISGYFFAHKGQDLPNIIHEFACKEEVKEKFLEKLSKYKLWLPENYLDTFPDAHLQYLALIKVTEKLPSFLEKWSNSDLSQISQGPIDVQFTFKEQAYNLEVPELLAGLFGPNPIEEFKKWGKPIYISGMDSA
jgi:predicted acetyltransferase